MLGKIFELIGSTISAADEILDITFTADEEAKESFSSFKKLFPWATYRDWWDLQAHKKSQGVLPDPTQSQSWKDRQPIVIGRREILSSALLTSAALAVSNKNFPAKDERSPKFDRGQWVRYDDVIDDDLDSQNGQPVTTVGFVTGMLLNWPSCRFSGWSYQVHVVIDRSVHNPCPNQIFHESCLKPWKGAPPI